MRIGVHRFKRLRRKLGLRRKQKCRFKATTNSKHDLPVAPNLLNQDFSVTAPHQAYRHNRLEATDYIKGLRR